MTYVVTRLCLDNIDTACVEVCPVDCFYKPTAPADDLPNQLYISPDECIDCGACVPECPWEAIFEEADVPPVFDEDLAINARSDSERDRFDVAEHDADTHKPSPAEIAENKAKYGYS
jgi:ferredoxin